MRKLRALPLIVALIVILSGCLGANTSSQSSSSESLTSCPLTHPGYGEFNVKNVIFKSLDGQILEENPSFLMPPNSTITIKGVIFAKRYKINNIVCYYGGKAELKAFLGSANEVESWHYLEGTLREVKNISVEIAPREAFIFPGKNATFEVEISAKNTHVGQNYYIYIVAFGEGGWKSWSRIEVKIWGSEETSH